MPAFSVKIIFRGAEYMSGRIKELRESVRLSQKLLGNKLGISQQVISRIERDDSTMTLEHLRLLADFFNVSTDYILGRTEARRTLEEDRIAIDRYQEGYHLILVYEMLREDYQELAWEILRKMAELTEEMREKTGDF